EPDEHHPPEGVVAAIAFAIAFAIPPTHRSLLPGLLARPLATRDARLDVEHGGSYGPIRSSLPHGSANGGRRPANGGGERRPAALRKGSRAAAGARGRRAGAG